MTQGKEEKPGRGSTIRHGAFSKAIAERYQDPSTPEGKRWFLEFESKLIEDLGGHEVVNAAQRLLLCGIRAQLQVIDRISAYIDEREGQIVDEKGNLLPCLRSGFSTYMEGLRRNLEAIFSIAKKSPPRTPDLESYLKETYGPKAGEKEETKP